MGAPYDTLYPETMLWATGGGHGWCVMCGSLIAGATIINTVCDKKTAFKLVDQLFSWYEQTPLPTDISNKYAHERRFLVDKYKSTKIFKQTVAKSQLCHVSVTRWCKASGYATGSHERSERCARVAADVAAFTAQLLNKHADGLVESAYAMSANAQGCRSCHAKGKPFDEGGWTRGKMDCGECHGPRGKEINVSDGHYMGFKE